VTISTVLTLEEAVLGPDVVDGTLSPALVRRAQRRRPLLLRDALSGGRRDAVALLLAHGWQPDLHDCAALGDIARLRTHLVDQSPTVEDDHGAQPLHLASRAGYAEAVSALLAAGACPRARWGRALDPLHLAAAGGHTDVIHRLLQAGADPHARDEAGFTALHVVAARGLAPAARRLLLAGARPDPRAVGLARRSGCQQTLGLLLQLAPPAAPAWATPIS